MKDRLRRPLGGVVLLAVVVSTITACASTPKSECDFASDYCDGNTAVRCLGRGGGGRGTAFFAASDDREERTTCAAGTTCGATCVCEQTSEIGEGPVDTVGCLASGGPPVCEQASPSECIVRAR